MSTGDAEGPRSLVRPYTVTGGRTATRYDLAVEALVLTTADGPGDTAGRLPEARAIRELCRECRSVAEIAAHLAVPLGVARVLVEDVAEEGLVHVYQTASEQGSHVEGRPDRAILERVLGGLREL